MGTSRRQFIKGGAALTALSTFDLQNSAAEVIRNSKDSNIELCLAYFYGLQERKIELSKQMGVTGAVSPSAPGVAGHQRCQVLDARGSYRREGHIRKTRSAMEGAGRNPVVWTKQNWESLDAMKK